MRLELALIALLFAVSIHSLPAHALVKCTSQGKTSYSDTPCPSGQPSQSLNPAAPPDPDHARDALRKTARDKSELQRLRTERERRIAQEDSARARAEAGRLAHQKKCKLLGMRKRWSDEDAARADLKSEARAKRTARRKAEQYDLECE
jgi:hypothetical protein